MQNVWVDRCTQGFGGGNLRERHNIENPDIDDSNITIDFQEVRWGA